MTVDIRQAARNALAAYQWFLDKDDLDALRRAFTELQKALDVQPEKLGLIGRDRVLVRALARHILKNSPHGSCTTDLRETADRRGFIFDVYIPVDGKPTNRIARVTIKLDRVETAATAGEEDQ